MIPASSPALPSPGEPAVIITVLTDRGSELSRHQGALCPVSLTLSLGLGTARNGPAAHHDNT